jgi:adenosylmethionine-8-amino-7-oxononanoate aminotransferase
MFACQKEKVTPDFLCVAKGLTGGYLPMAATLTTQAVFDAFLGEYEEFKTFFHGHSYTGNQLGAAAALASLDILQGSESKMKRRGLEKQLRDELQTLWSLAAVGDVRQEGLVAGVELVADACGVSAEGAGGHSRVRGDGAAGRVDAADWKCDSVVAAVLYDAIAVAEDGEGVAGIDCGGVG